MCRMLHCLRSEAFRRSISACTCSLSIYAAWDMTNRLFAETRQQLGTGDHKAAKCVTYPCYCAGVMRAGRRTMAAVIFSKNCSVQRDNQCFQ